MTFLHEVAIGIYCAVGTLYAVWLLSDCWAWWRARIRGVADARAAPGAKLRRRAGPGQWWCQTLSAGLLLIVAATLFARIWENEASRMADAGRRDAHLREMVMIHGLPSIAAVKVVRDGTGPDCPIRGIDLAFEPITDANICRLSREAVDLEFLNLTETHVTDEGVTYLQKMPRLKTLTLTRTRVTDASCTSLAQFTNLEALWLAGTSITDDGLRNLGNLTNLKWFGVSDTGVTDAGLESLENLRRLEYLDVRGTQVTGQGAAALQEKLPSLTQVIRR